MRKLVILVFISFLISCEKDEDNYVDPNYSYMDELFEGGFSMKLEQVYAYVKVGSYHEMVDSVFKDKQSITTLPNYAISGTTTLIMGDIVKGERWTFDKPIRNEYEVIIDNGGVNDPTFSYKVKTMYIPLNRNNSVIDKNFRITYAGEHNIYGKFAAKIKFFTDKDEYTNLIIEDIVYNSKEMVLKTNKEYILNQNIFPPLTSKQVKIELQNNNYELFLYEANTYYKIGENLYKPSFNDNYIYVGSTNNNGLLNSYYQVQYYLKFKL
ncbi:hypothetical protein M2451_000558 [Dysgonomonas sp. PFB1-18]|uniref:hypothetical protein n=1 Tax=unclassified Dysgonomonas TaxID=2630389 RepID=UPI0024764AA5|nr:MULTISPECIES: hypothetical protein [unclassified Dysgonomonas]MDH6307409.1 hypothetical protein [Dysgonomonas sp. PF1-14]MDH6337327.1 hypothetical protein [Dysgonomonas sp. PF1-16]MDH6379251.1 hypothetical protein [Dysgonomonas sp. PFB1-18]MDH6396111.1 hypothetical protein [Dysgonomonas sp. PF1-23]